MSWYAQEKYNDKVGNGPFTIKEIGCFITSFANTLKKFGESEAPDFLNLFFTEHHIYLPDPADGSGVHDDLAWGSITAYDPTVTISHTGSTGWPDSDNAIVEFAYNHNGKRVNHFCAVASHANHTIIDSYDGQIKEPGFYGEPITWAVYCKNSPRPVIAPHPSSQPVKAGPPNYDGESITIQPGWGLSNAAYAAGFPDANTETRWTIIANMNGSNNWNDYNNSLKPGERIKVGKPATMTAASGSKIVTVEAGWGLERVAAAAGRTDANKPECWQSITLANGGSEWQTFTEHLQPGQKLVVPPEGGHGEGVEAFDPSKVKLDQSTKGLYKSLADLTYANLVDPTMTKHVSLGAPVVIAGTFSWQNVDYALPLFSYNEGSSYAIPLTDLQSMKQQRKSLYQHFLATVGGTIGFLTRNKLRKAA